MKTSNTAHPLQHAWKILSLSSLSTAFALVGVLSFYAEPCVATYAGTFIFPLAAIFAGIQAHRRARSHRLRFLFRAFAWTGILFGSYVALMALVLIVYAQISEHVPNF